MKLRKAIESNNTEKVRELLLNGKGIDIADEKGMTPLMWAAQAQLPEMVELILEFGANPKLEDNLGYNALGIACFNGETSNNAYSRECKRIIDAFKKVGLKI